MMMSNEQPGATLDRRIKDLGDSLVERTDRIASDIAHCNAQIEKLKARDLWFLSAGMGWLVILAIVSYVMCGARW
jgi:hypothetical protein